jgi:hypothetical protein
LNEFVEKVDKPMLQDLIKDDTKNDMKDVNEEGNVEPFYQTTEYKELLDRYDTNPMVALHLYSMETKCKHVIDLLSVLWKDNEFKKVVLPHQSFILDFVTGFHSLPPMVVQTKEVYRVIRVENKVDAKRFCEYGSLITWPGFTRATKSIQFCHDLCQAVRSGEEKKDTWNVLFCIKLVTSRAKSLACISLDEVILPCMSFRVKSSTESTKARTTIVELEEVNMEIENRRIFLCVDDHPRSDTYVRVSTSLAERVLWISSTSTKQALDFIQKFKEYHHEDLLLRNQEDFRICTDAMRIEDGKANVDAGFELVQELRKQNYTGLIMVFCGSKFLDINRTKFQTLGLVKVTDQVQDFVPFASFGSLETSSSS